MEEAQHRPSRRCAVRGRAASTAGLLAALVVAGQFRGGGPVAGAAGSGGMRSVARGPGAHLLYRWANRKGGVVLRYEVHVYSNGFIRLARSVGGGTPQEVTLPNDSSFAKDLIDQVERARRWRHPTSPCGAPQGGVLSITTGRRERRFDLSDGEQWKRFGLVVRRLLGHVTGHRRSPLEGDCAPLLETLDLERAGRRRPSRPRARPRAPEPELLLRYGMAQSAEERSEALADLALRPGADPALRTALLARYPGSLAARRLLRRHAGVLVRQVGSAAEARELLGRLRGLQTVETLYHQAVLLLVLRRFDAAAGRWSLFHEQLVQDRAAARVRQRLSGARRAAVDLRRRRPPWGRIRRAPARLFRFWLDLAEAIWSGPPEHAPPLARLLYARAIHYAVQSALAPSIRASGAGAGLLSRAVALARAYYPVLSAGPWDALPYWRQHDLLTLAGLFRRRPHLFGANWVAAHADPPERVLCQMVRMRYFGPAARYVDRIGGQHPDRKGALLLAWGRCLTEQERFEPARKALVQALALGVAGARSGLVLLRAEQGDLEGAAREAEVQLRAAPADAAQLRAFSRVERLRGRPAAAMAAARKAIRASASEPDRAASRLALGRAAAAAGRFQEALRAFERAARGAGEAAVQARFCWARLLWRRGRYRPAIDAVWPLAARREAWARAAAHALVALVADRLGLQPLVSLEVARAEHHARFDPRALAEAAALLIEGGVALPVAARLLRRAEGKRPGWSRIAALKAWLLARAGRLPAAHATIRTALRLRPGFPPYRLLERAIVLERFAQDTKGTGPARPALAPRTARRHP